MFPGEGGLATGKLMGTLAAVFLGEGEAGDHVPSRAHMLDTYLLRTAVWGSQ